MAKPKKTKRRPRRVDPLRAWSDAELQREANRLLNAGLIQPKQQIARERAEARRQAEADQRAIQGFTSALAGIVGHAGPAVDRVYADATRRQTDIARGLGGQQQGMDQGAADQANSLLAAQGQTRRIDPGTGGQVTYALGGMVPSTLLNETGAAMSSIAHGYGAGVAGRGQQALQLRQAQAAKEQAKIREAMDELMAKVPGLRADILDKLYQREISKSATATQRDYLRLSQGREAFDQQFDLAKLQADIAADAAKNKGKKNDAANKAKAKAREARLGALDSSRQDAFVFADRMFKQTKRIPGAPEPVSSRPTWQAAYAALWHRYGEGLMRFAPQGQKPWWRGQVETMLVNVLKGAGFTKRTSKLATKPRG